jgi:hypothetical protein
MKTLISSFQYAWLMLCNIEREIKRKKKKRTRRLQTKVQTRVFQTLNSLKITECALVYSRK